MSHRQAPKLRDAVIGRSAADCSACWRRRSSSPRPSSRCSSSPCRSRSSSDRNCRPRCRISRRSIAGRRRDRSGVVVRVSRARRRTGRDVYAGDHRFCRAARQPQRAARRRLARRLLLLLPYLLGVVVWSFLWGAALRAFRAWLVPIRLLQRPARGRSCASSSSACSRPSCSCCCMSSIHPLLFGPCVARICEAAAATERTAFMLRSVAVPGFGVGADDPEPHRRLRARRDRDGVGGDRRSMRSAKALDSCAATPDPSWRLYVLTGLLFVALLDRSTATSMSMAGRRVTGWRGIAIAQAYIVARLVIRLTFGASEVRLYRALAGAGAMCVVSAGRHAFRIVGSTSGHVAAAVGRFRHPQPRTNTPATAYSDESQPHGLSAQLVDRRGPVCHRTRCLVAVAAHRLALCGCIRRDHLACRHRESRRESRRRRRRSRTRWRPRNRHWPSVTRLDRSPANLARHAGRPLVGDRREPVAPQGRQPGAASCPAGRCRGCPAAR